MSLRMAWLRRDEGSTIAAVLMVMMVVTAVGVSSIQVAQHLNDATTVDRERLQSVQSAEAGANEAIRRLASGEATCTSGTDASRSDLFDGSQLVGQYQIQYETTGNPGTCLIRSWGFAATGRTGDGPGTRAMRIVEVEVELVPLGGFIYSLFAEGPTGTVVVNNNGTIIGDVYAENLDQTHNNLSAENVISPGSIDTDNNANYTGTLWAGGDVHVGEDSTVGGSVIAAGTDSGSSGNIQLDNNVVVNRDAVANGSITLDNGAVVHGSTSPDSPNVPSPPDLTKPTFTWNAANYTDPEIGGESFINGEIAAVKNDLQGAFHMTNAGGTVTFPTNTTITGDLTIVSQGRIEAVSNLRVRGSGFTIVFVALSTAQDAIELKSNFSAPADVDVLLYTLGGVRTNNNNSFTGVIYADQIEVNNNLLVHRSDTLISNPPPGFTFSGTSATAFNVVPTLWREIVPDTFPS